MPLGDRCLAYRLLALDASSVHSALPPNKPLPTPGSTTVPSGCRLQNSRRSPTWLNEEERRREGVPHRVAREVEPLQLIPLSRPVVARKGRPITQCPMHSVGSPPQGVVEQAQNSRPGAPFSKCDAQPAANLLFSRVTSGNISISSAHSRWSSGS